jgi:outer membrane protein, heavy metal efflux system
VESEKVVSLYEKTIRGAGEPNVSEALAAYTTGKAPFLSLVEAQRNLFGLRERYFESLADYYRRLARLERVVGGPIFPHGENR